MPEDRELVVGTITIRRVLLGDRDFVTTEAVDTGGETLPLVEALGLLELAKDTVIREAMGEIVEDDEDEDDE